LTSGAVKCGAPSIDAYRKLISNLRKGNSRTNIDDVGERKKLRKMMWTTAEAIRAGKRKFLDTAATIAVHQDKQGKVSRLGMMFTASDSKLEQCSGVVGYRQQFGPHLNALTATDEMWRRFWTVGSGCPQLEPNKYVFDKNRADRARHKVEFVATDAAGDASLAARRMGKTQHVICQTEATFPNKKIGNWDRAHGARRINQRTMDKDEYIKTTIEEFISKRRSITRLIQSSTEFRNIYVDHKSRLVDVAKKAVNLSYSHHRYDSESKPHGRGVINVRALIKTADTIRRIRKGTPEGAEGESFLKFVDTERCIIFAMSADAGDEQIVVIRDNDATENATTEEISFNVEQMMNNLHILFIDRRCLLSGYTKYMLDVLSNTPMTVIVDNKPKIIGCKGGVTDAIMNRCFERMACYVRMARAVASAEFPDFDLLTSFSVYSLSERRRVSFDPSHMNNTQFIDKCLERQAAFFGLPADKLKDEYNFLWPAGAAIFRSKPHLSVPQAFGAAMNRRGSQLEVIRRPLECFAGWKYSTSYLEQSFAKMLTLWGAQSRSGDDDLVEDIYTIGVETLTEIGWLEIYAEAQKLWLRYFGSSYAPRSMDTRLKDFRRRKKGPQPNPEMTEKRFIELRRSAVANEAATFKKDTAAMIAEEANASSKQWTPRMDGEIKFQNDKRMKRKVDDAHNTY
jgi:hypothetical protein